MILDTRMKKYLKVLTLFAFVILLAGCTSNTNADGTLKAARAINEATKWDISAGFFDFFLVIPIAKGILFINHYLGNVLWGVIGMTILINLIILPIMIKSTISQQKMQLLQPEIERIQAKYKGRNDSQSQLRMQQEMQALYSKNDVSMFGSLTTLLTLPIMLAMWQSVQRVEILYQTQVLGLNLGATPMSQITSGHYQYVILIVAVAITQFFAIEINNIMLKNSKNYKPSKMQNNMKTMNIMMTLMIMYFGLIMATAMSFYWITTNIITVLRTIYIQKKYVEPALAEKNNNVIR